MFLNYLLTALAPLIGGGNFIIGSKIERGTFFSKDYTSMLKGVCCLIVIYVHFHGAYTNTLQDAIGSFGYIAVTLFFLISAYGMMLSSERKKNYLNHFWRNRLIALLIPCLCVNLLGIALSFAEGSFEWHAIYQINGYVKVLLQFCLWFYIIEFCKRKWFPKKHQLGDSILIAGIVISSIFLYLFIYDDSSSTAGWCFERMGLVWGILLNRYYQSFVKWMDSHRGIKAVILCVISAVLGITYLKFKLVWFWGAYLLKIVLGLFIILFLFTATSNRKIGNRFGLWLGNISYEVYLSHGMVMGFLAYAMSELSSGMFILITVVATLILSYFVHSIDKIIVKKLRV